MASELMANPAANVTGVDQVNRILYAPAPGLIESGSKTLQQSLMAGQDAASALKALDAVFSKVHARDLFAAGQVYSQEMETSPDQAKPTVRGSETVLRKKPFTIVIVPGVFGEFIDTLGFHDVLENQGSQASRSWKALISTELARKGSCSNPTRPHCDSRFLLKDMKAGIPGSGKSGVSLGELLTVASIDDAQGNELVNVVLFNTPTLSLESLGDISEKAAIFNRRLAKYFALTGVPENVAFLGYSRGTMVGLEMLSQAQQQGEGWLKNVRGMVSLGGVVFGSGLADQATNEVDGQQGPSIVSQQLAALEELKGSLQTVTQANARDNLKIRLANGRAWFQALKKLAALEAQGSGEQASFGTAMVSFIRKMRESQKRVDPKAGVALALKVAFQYGALPERLEPTDNAFQFAKKIAKTMNHLTFTDYSVNIERFEKTVDAVLIAVRQLSTRSRLEWWRTHRVPVEGITYYSVSATMDDPSSDFAKTQVSYDLSSEDYVSLSQSYLELAKVSKTALNDSQVAMQRTIFWPELVAALNPANAGMDSAPLAFTGTTHWGLALRVVNQTRDGHVDRFPRAALLKSIAEALAYDQ